MAKETKDKKAVGASKGKWNLYSTQGDLKRERKSCPKCGAGVFMAQHQDRVSCGKCGYTEFTKEKLIIAFPSHRKKEKREEKVEKTEKAEEPATPVKEEKKGKK